MSALFSAFDALAGLQRNFQFFDALAGASAGEILQPQVEGGKGPCAGLLYPCFSSALAMAEGGEFWIAGGYSLEGVPEREGLGRGRLREEGWLRAMEEEAEQKNGRGND